MPNLKSQAKTAFIWDFTGKIAMQGSGFIVTIFLSRLLEPSDFGLIAMIMVVIGIAGIFSDVGLGGALVQRKRVLPIHYSSVFYFNMLVASILSLLTYLSAPLIADFFKSPELVLLTQVLSVLFILGSVNSVHIVQLKKELNFKRLTQINFTSSLLSGVIGVFLAFEGYGVWSLVAQQLISSMLNVVFLWNASAWRPGLEFSLKALFQLWGFGFRMFLSEFLASVFERLDYIIIGRLFPVATLGFFQRAKSLNQLVVGYSSGSLMSILFPLLSKIKNDLPRFQNITIKAFGIICFVSFFLVGTLYLVSNELIVILFTEKWLPSVELFQILALTGFVYPLSALLVNVLSSRGNSKAYLHLEIYKKIISIGSFIVLYFFGIEAYLYGLIVTSSLALSLNILFASREIKLSFFIFAKPVIVQICITVIVVFAVMLITANISYNYVVLLFLKLVLFSMLYIMINHALKIKSYLFIYSEIKPMIQKKFKGNI